jgi:hypothetical protein
MHFFSFDVYFLYHSFFTFWSFSLQSFCSSHDLFFSLPLLFVFSSIFYFDLEFLHYTGCRNINVFQVGSLVGKNLKNLEKIK